MTGKKPEYPEKLLSALEKLDDSPIFLSAEQNDRISRMALERISCGGQTELKPHLESLLKDTKVRKMKGINSRKKHLRRTLRIGLIAAALFCASAVTVYAVGPELMTMLREKIGFFEEAPAQQTVSDPAEAPRGEYSEMKKDLEVFNAAVGQSVTDNGVTVTLDNISMDIAGMDVFFTVSGEEAIREVTGSDEYVPVWSKFFGSGPDFLYPEVNGKSLVCADLSDWYLAEDGSLKLWKHYSLLSVPEGEEITVTLSENRRALNRPGNWSFSVSLDGDSVRAGGRIAEPAVYPLPERVYSVGDDTEITGNRDIRLEYLAFGPKGGVISTEVTEREGKDGKGRTFYILEGTPADELLITDSTGKELYLSRNSSSGGNTAFCLTAPDPAADAVTLTPVGYDFQGKNPEECEPEQRTVTAEELKNGVRLPTSPAGGYTVRNFEVRGHHISYELVPYGWTQNIELIPEDEGVSMVSEEADGGILCHSGLLSSTADPRTGVISVRTDYYAASEEELNRITEWHYSYNPWRVLEPAQAVTVSLQKLP